MKVYKMTLLAFLVALAVVFHYVEGFIPNFLPIPGFKLGLANIVGVFALFYMGPFYYVAVQVLRIVIVALIAQGFGTAFLLSVGGAVLSIIGSLLLYYLTRTSIYGVSVVGAFLHVCGQVFVYMIIVRTYYMVLYLPILSLMSMIAGGVLAILVGMIIKVLPSFDTMVKNRRR